MSGYAKFQLTNPTALTNVTAHYVDRAALEILRDGRNLCPVDTGNLVNSLTQTATTRGVTDVTTYITTDVHYAPYVEFGTRYMRGFAFLGKALEMAKRKWGG